MLCFCFERCSIACSIPKLLLESYHTSDKQHWQRKDKITQCVFNYGGHHIPFNLERSNAPEFATQDSAADALRRLVQGSEAEAVNDSIYTPKPFREILATGHSDPPKTLLRLVCVCLHVFWLALFCISTARLCANILQIHLNFNVDLPSTSCVKE